MNEGLYELYSVPQAGGLLPVFSGSRRHLVGGGFFSTIARFALPILKTLGRSVLRAGAKGATSYLSGEKKFMPSMVDEFTTEATNLVERGIKKLRKRKQSGKGRKNINKKRKCLF